MGWRASGSEFAKSEPAPAIGILRFGDSSIDIAVRYWVPTARYFQSQFAANNAVWQSLAPAGITIPYPKRELHIVKGELAHFI